MNRNTVLALGTAFFLFCIGTVLVENYFLRDLPSVPYGDWRRPLTRRKR